MKRFVLAAVAALFFLTIPTVASAQCNKIKDGGILDSAGNPVSLGYDQYGYNYQARMFNGLYDNFSRPVPTVTEGSVTLMMKWSEEWLASVDCNGDGKLDRGLNTKTGVSNGVSQGWLTNHEEGDYFDTNGDSHHYTYFVKIVYDAGAACNTSDPSCIWGLYRIIEEVFNDPDGGLHGADRSRLLNPAGLGYYTN